VIEVRDLLKVSVDMTRTLDGITFGWVRCYRGSDAVGPSPASRAERADGDRHRSNLVQGGNPMAAKTTTATRKKSKVFTEAETTALQDTVEERRRASHRDPAAAREDGERDVQEQIALMAPADRVIAKRIHAIVTTAAPELVPRTWYGLPAYAKEGKIICFFKAASKYKERYAAFGFDQAANLEEGTMWPSAWFLTKLTPADEKLITSLVKKAVR
jgi:hypothetical protein